MELKIDFNPQQGHVSYEGAYESCLPAAPLNQWVQSFWQLNVPSGHFSYHSVPDNCVDWVINTECFEDSFVVAPFLSPLVFDLAGPVSYFGIRFRVLGQQTLISTPLGEWALEDEIHARELLSNSLIHEIFESVNRSMCFHKRCHQVAKTILSNVQPVNIDTRVARYIRYCDQNPLSNIRLSDAQCAEFGLSARQLRRLSQLYLGMSPRDFARVLRFQRTLNSMKSMRQSMAWHDHYYDQPHYIREFKRLAGLTPSKFANSSVLYNQHVTA